MRGAGERSELGINSQQLTAKPVAVNPEGVRTLRIPKDAAPAKPKARPGHPPNALP